VTLQTNHYRLLIVDDNEAIHADLKKILLPRQSDPDMAADEELLFGTTTTTGVAFEIDFAFQGKEGLECIQRAQAEGRPYALAFVDVRMPPGWDGVETIGYLWEEDPDLQVVICTAYSDYDWNDISKRLGVSHNLVILKKPFDIIEVSQLAHAMTAKWTSMLLSRLQMEEQDRLVEERTSKLSAANTQLRLNAAALEAAANSITITDSKGIIVWTNPAFTALSGYSAMEVLGTNRHLLNSGLQSEEITRPMREAFLLGKMWHGEVVNHRKDGSVSFDEMTITPFASQSGEITHFIAINQDITQRKMAEAALLEAKEKYQALFEDAVVGIFQATPEGKLLNINRAFATMRGYESAEQLLAELSVDGRMTLIDPTRITEWRQELEKHGSIRSVEVEIRCRDGSRKWALMNIRARRNSDGVVVHDGTLEDITEHKAAQQRVYRLAYYDDLTGLANRALLRNRLNTAIAAASQPGCGAALLYLDIDRFKLINDSLGHSVGDLLLQQVAIRLKNEICEKDTVARAGGDEFLIVLTSAESVDQVTAIAARIVESLVGEFTIQGYSLSITCSLGISMFPQHGEDGETLIKNADVAMFAAKEQGRNSFCFFTSEMNTLVIERMSIENGLRSAIHKEELFLVYQPQFNISTGSVTGLEALIRWQHPERGLVMPDKFIQIAESSGLINPVGKWVLRTACAQMKRWQDEGCIKVPVAVNVSAVQFRHGGFLELIKSVLHETGLEPQYLELELTESLLLSSEDVMFEVLQDLKAMGVKLAIDDFGTGYSSLSYLRQFPLTKLKIDRSFIRDVAVNPDDAAIAAAILSMAKGLNLKVIAEGVEDEAQLSFLREHECDECQGYYFSRPLNVKDAADTLGRREARPSLDPCNNSPFG
jgi:diguanylate cyclase (GGDEF)-like protein/PAS domain S-box-containing protein